MRIRLMSSLRICAAMAAMVAARALNAQEASTTDSQPKAAAKMEFEVASVREDKGPFTPPSFALSVDDAYIANTDALTADFPLSVYIEFAYKLWLTPGQRHALYDPLPKWVATDRYAIRAKVDHPATKDQIRPDQPDGKMRFHDRVRAASAASKGKRGVWNECGAECSRWPGPARGRPGTIGAAI